MFVFDSAKHRAENPSLKLQSEVGHYVTGLSFECLDILKNVTIFNNPMNNAYEMRTVD